MDNDVTRSVYPLLTAVLLYLKHIFLFLNPAVIVGDSL